MKKMILNAPGLWTSRKRWDNKFTMNLLKQFGHTDFSKWNVKWEWLKIGSFFNKYVEKLIAYLIEDVKKGNDIACPFLYLWTNNMIDDESELVQEIIKLNNIHYLYELICRCEIAFDWATLVIENSSERSKYAFNIGYHFKKKREWAIKVVERDSDLEYIYLTYKYLITGEEWLKVLVEKSTDVQNKARIAFEMAKDSLAGSDIVLWAERVISDCRDLTYSKLLVDNLKSKRSWYEELKNKVECESR